VAPIDRSALRPVRKIGNLRHQLPVVAGAEVRYGLRYRDVRPNAAVAFKGLDVHLIEDDRHAHRDTAVGQLDVENGAGRGSVRAAAAGLAHRSDTPHVAQLGDNHRCAGGIGRADQHRYGPLERLRRVLAFLQDIGRKLRTQVELPVFRPREAIQCRIEPRVQIAPARNESGHPVDRYGADRSSAVQFQRRSARPKKTRALPAMIASSMATAS
jgi:hypothetical protein